MYSWAANKLKLSRAIGTMGEGDENVVKAEYIRIGGLLTVESVVETPVIEESAEEVIEVPKKRSIVKKVASIAKKISKKK